MSIDKVPDHTAAGIANLLSQYKDSPTVLNFLTVLLSQLQPVEDDLVDLIFERMLATAVGVQLDQYGKVVGANRRGLVDDDFRKYIRVRIQANLSTGIVDTILDVVSVLVGNLVVRYDRIGTAAYQLQWETDSPVSGALLELVNEILLDISPAGVGYFATQGSLNPLRFDTAGQGLDDGEMGEAVAMSP
ncbi:MAG: hypothetical protein KAI73_04150 [Rhodospirillaceae bacterium]|nr:hypothetical protein [Rhodospirillaceae bacterium]